MSFRKRLVYLLLILLALVALDAFCAPFLMARGLRLWVEWAARRQGLSVYMASVEAPFLRPVVVHGLALTSAPGLRREISLRAETLIIDLNLRAWIFGQQEQLLRSIQADHLNGRVHVPEKASAGARLDWRQFARLLPDNFRVDDLNLEVATATTTVDFRGLLLSASAIESGRFVAREISIRSPFLRRTFLDLRGATSWESSRLTIAGIPLAQGLDLEALTFDLSHLARRRLGIDLHLDTYGGTLRASFRGRAGDKFFVDLAGSAANISLAQFSSAIGFLEPVTGTVRASKFTFRGNPGEFLDGTASIWMEATDFAWRARRAESVMLGATYYDRRLEVDQLYVRQRQNELTVNGELVWPKRRGSWWQLPFRGQLNATIPDLNALAQFFGATTGDFSGALKAEGAIDLVAPEISGRLSGQGAGVKFRGVALDSLGGRLRLRGREATLELLEARHEEDFLRAEGTVELATGHRFSGRLTGAINDLGVYAPLLPAAWQTGKIGGGATFDWRGDGTFAAHSGTVQLFAHGLQLPVAPLRGPLDLTLEGSYSPQDIFFRTFKLAGDQFSLGGFLMLGRDFVELQSFELALGGVTRARGTIFLPLSVPRWRETHHLLQALEEKQKFDLDLAIEQLDLAQLAQVLGEETERTGRLSGKLAAFGPLASLQLTTDLRLENLGPADKENTLTLNARLAKGRLEAEASARFGVSSPLQASLSLPVQLDKHRLQNGHAIEQSAPFSVTLEAPALFLETLPNEWRPVGARGLFSGSLQWGGTLAAPLASGEADLLDLSLAPPAPWPAVKDLSAHLSVQKRVALLDPIQAKIGSAPVALRGRLSTGLTDFALTLFPAGETIALAQLPPKGATLSSIHCLEGEPISDQPALRSLLLRGRLPGGISSLTITSQAAADVSPRQRTFFRQPKASETARLLLRIIPPTAADGFELGRGYRPILPNEP